MASKSITPRKVFSFILIVLSFVWVGSILHGELASEGIEKFIPDHYGWLSVACLLLVFSMALGGVKFYYFLNVNADLKVKFLFAAKLYMVGQIVRYLPGRFWGVVYQVNSSKKELEMPTVLKANVDMMLFALAFNFVIAGVVMTMTDFIADSLGYPVVLCSILFMPLLFLGGLQKFADYLHSKVPIKYIKLRKLFYSITRFRMGISVFFKLIIISSIGWLMYLLSWWLLQYSFDFLYGQNMLLLCVMYSIAWIVGFASALTPGGLGVREVTFVVLATPVVGTEIASFIAIFARPWMMLADIVLAVVCAFAQRNMRTIDESRAS